MKVFVKKTVNIRTGNSNTLRLEFHADGDLVISRYCDGQYINGSVQHLKMKAAERLTKALQRYSHMGTK